MPPKKSKIKLEPNRIYTVENPDKTTHERWGDSKHPIENVMNFPGPYRWLICGQPNSGKTTLIYNILCQMDPPPRKIYLIHADSFESKRYWSDPDDQDFISDLMENVPPEYVDIDLTVLTSFPPLGWFKKLDTKTKKVLIIDDVNLLEYMKTNKTKRECMDKLFSYVSTHRNLTIISSFQNIFAQCAPSMYRYSSVYTIFKPRDRNFTSMLARKIGSDKKEMGAMLNLCKGLHDNITLDYTENSPMEKRFNLYKEITTAEIYDEMEKLSEAIKELRRRMRMLKKSKTPEESI